MRTIIFEDRTWSAYLTEKEAKEQKGNKQTADEKLSKAHYYWDNRMKPCAKMDYLVRKFAAFLDFNPEYVQNGIIQIAVSATKDVGAYQIGKTEYLEDVLVSLNPRRGLKYFVAMLSEAQNCASSHRRYRRCLCSNTYFMSCGEDGTVQLYKLLENDDWLFGERADYALEQVAKITGGTLLPEAPKWRKITIDGVEDICRLRYYETADKVKHALACFPNSGTILDEAADNLKIGEVFERASGAVDYNNRLIRFRLRDDNVISRVNSNNPAFNSSLH